MPFTTIAVPADANDPATYYGVVVSASKNAAGAKALLFPTQWNESFGLVMAEALMSGTPVISSSNGACPELITPDVGWICNGPEDYARAILRAHEVAPAKCREKAMRDFHYRRMAVEYVVKYEQFLRCGRL